MTALHSKSSSEAIPLRLQVQVKHLDGELEAVMRHTNHLYKELVGRNGQLSGLRRATRLSCRGGRVSPAPLMLPIINNLESYPKFIVALFDNNWYSWTVWIWVSCTKSATIDWESTPYYDAYVCCEQRQSIVRGVLWLECPSSWVQNFGKQNFMTAELFIFYLNAKMLTYLQPMIPHT